MTVTWEYVVRKAEFRQFLHRHLLLRHLLLHPNLPKPPHPLLHLNLHPNPHLNPLLNPLLHLLLLKEVVENIRNRRLELLAGNRPIRVNGPGWPHFFVKVTTSSAAESSSPISTSSPLLTASTISKRMN